MNCSDHTEADWPSTRCQFWGNTKKVSRNCDSPPLAADGARHRCLWPDQSTFHQIKQRGPVELATLGPRNGGQYRKESRALWAESIMSKTHELFRTGGIPELESDHTDGDILIKRRFHRYAGHIPHARIHRHNVLNLGRINIDTVEYQHIVGTTAEDELTIGGESTKVPWREPALAKQRRVGFGIVKKALDHSGAPQPDLADFSGRHRLAVGPQEADFHLRSRSTYSARR